jgi:membrane-bound lytic murein transglycosylase MltF
MNPAVPPALRRNLTRRNLAILLVGLVLFCMSTCSPHRDLLTQIRTAGVLRIATINSPTTYYQGANSPAGFEYDLAKGLANSLGVKLEVITTRSASEALNLTQLGRAHIAAAAVVVTPERSGQVRFSKPLFKVVPQLVYRAGQNLPKDFNELKGLIRIARGSVDSKRLRELKQQNPALQWDEVDDQETEELLYQVANNQLSYTIANSDIVAITQRYYPQLRVAFALSKPQDIAWGFALGDDSSLYDAADQYLKQLSDKEFTRLYDRYFGHVEQVNVLGAVTLATDVQTRLSRYRKAFEEAAAQYHMDWRLLAAMGYQESHWDEDAISPTGVRGLMMLTMDTAERLEVKNREDATQSIFGGARYFRLMQDSLPPSIKEPDRTWMTLATYNIGLGHLLDARKLTQSLGGDPNHWLDVRNTLPLLTQARFHNQTDHGYARGFETVTYVGNVRTYFDMLNWITSGAPARKKPSEAEPPLQLLKREQQKKDNPLNITTPVF